MNDNKEKYEKKIQEEAAGGESYEAIQQMKRSKYGSKKNKIQYNQFNTSRQDGAPVQQ